MKKTSRMLLPLMLAATLSAQTALASIPDFTVFNVPESVQSAKTPAARKFWNDLVEHSKQQGRKMFEDTKKQTGLKNADMRKKDWDCLFWRTAATFANSIATSNPGFLPTTFAEELSRTALDKDDCDDNMKGPGGRGVLVYTTVAHNITAKDGGWQKTASATPGMVPAYAKSAKDLIQMFAALGVVIGDAAEGAATTLAGGLLPVLVLPEQLVEELKTGRPAKSL
jgi:hypothetical protein